MHATTFHSDVRIETNLVELCAHVIVADLGQGQFPRTHEPNSRGACAIGYIASRFHGLRSVSFLLPQQATLQLCRPMVGAL